MSGATEVRTAPAKRIFLWVAMWVAWFVAYFAWAKPADRRSMQVAP
jgi:hypothetical protein